MNYFLRKKGWSLETIDAITHLMKTPMAILHSQEPPLAAKTVIRWGCTSNLLGNPKVINSSKAIHRVFNKREFRMELENYALCPRTWFTPQEFLFDHEAYYPVIVRPATHAQGLELYLCNNLKELKAAWRKVGEVGYISKYINKVAEYRYFVANDRVVTAYKKFPKKAGMILFNDIEEYIPFEEWSIPAVKAAIKAHELSRLHWSAIDIIEDKNKKPYVLEINTAPEIQSPYRQKCMAKVFDYMLTKETKGILPVDKPDNWKKYIHPAISNLAYIN